MNLTLEIALAVWLVAVGFVLALCAVAARADLRELGQERRRLPSRRVPNERRRVRPRVVSH